MNLYPFIEAEKAQQRSVKRACELLEVSRAAFYQQPGRAVPAGPGRRRAGRGDPGRAQGIQGPLRRPAGARRAAPRKGTGTAASGSPG